MNFQFGQKRFLLRAGRVLQPTGTAAGIDVRKRQNRPKRCKFPASAFFHEVDVASVIALPGLDPGLTGQSSIPGRWLLVERFRNSNHIRRHSGSPSHIRCCRCARRKCRSRVNPRSDAASPESITTGRGLWIPGSPPSVAPRNDQAAHMIGFESLH
jgi:hypothetical protein